MGSHSSSRPDERADEPGLGLPALAEEDDVVARQQGVLELREDGLPQNPRMPGNNEAPGGDGLLCVAAHLFGASDTDSPPEAPPIGQGRVGSSGPGGGPCPPGARGRGGIEGRRGAAIGRSLNPEPGGRRGAVGVRCDER